MARVDRLGRSLPRPFTAWPRWALIASATAFAIVFVLGFVYYLWIGLAFVICTILGLAAVWAWFELPDRYEEGPDRAELREQDRWRRMMGD